ncbi:AzlC family ABC transporter permease [Tenuibacillus multivorans]|uniref:4-azaleucine resistance probable transporter AzlC n=1 Tax=Tenuibacillus multivorans TaxID=237069 RepID=A0A1H0EXD0_9BACI|nr:AzlC family ABC transporter permease [Tenuibacillus multivorans]GEL76918.1 autotransporter [Tenuibacillus multivorans]SDN87032.1 4-azaleucine resistance probable transporter AzlC [Tenuibacillus multivorans]
MEHVQTLTEEEFSKQTAIKKGLVAGFPIFLGYLPIAIAYGVLAKESGLSTMETTMMSVLVFAGASQLMAAGLFASGAMFVEIVIATFVLNFRHFIMSMSFMNKAKDFPVRWKFLLSLGLTDETFAVSSLHGGKAKHKYGTLFYLALILFAYIGWILGSLAGALLGDIIPTAISQSMGIALYAMFIGLLAPSVKKEWRIGIIAAFSMLINYILYEPLGFKDQQEGWAIVISTIIGSLLGIFLLKEDDES